MKTYRINITVTGGVSLPAFSVTAHTAAQAAEKFLNIVDGLGGMSRVESGYMVDSSGTRHGLV